MSSSQLLCCGLLIVPLMLDCCGCWAAVCHAHRRRASVASSRQQLQRAPPRAIPSQRGAVPWFDTLLWGRSSAVNHDTRRTTHDSDMRVALHKGNIKAGIPCHRAPGYFSLLPLLHTHAPRRKHTTHTTQLRPSDLRCGRNCVVCGSLPP